MERFDAAAEKAGVVRQTKGVLLGLLLVLMIPVLLAALDDRTGYVICGTRGDAATQWDIRGH